MSKKSWLKQFTQENLIYLVVWGLLFVSPLLSMYVRASSDPGFVFEWAEVLVVMQHFVPFLLLFLIHNYLLAPLLVQGRRRTVYFSIVTVIVAAFAVYQCNSRPDRPIGHERPPHELSGHPERGPRPDGMRRLGEAPPPIVGEHDVMAVVLLTLMFAANVGIKGYYRGRNDRRRLAILERENLEQQLEYLRYQINPHFFMNTLNNIHALVDIDPEQAKETIVELSKMMRYVLYEGNKQCVPLGSELSFIRHYVSLMQLRYTDKVRITLDLPAEVPELQVPPLLLITFIENAFKHGVSYQKPSFIDIKVALQNRQLFFTCLNSKVDGAQKKNNGPCTTADAKQGGVGLANVRKRLELLFAGRYTFEIDETAETYHVKLQFPLTTEPLIHPQS